MIALGTQGWQLVNGGLHTTSGLGVFDTLMTGILHDLSMCTLVKFCNEFLYDEAGNAVEASEESLINW